MYYRKSNDIYCENIKLKDLAHEYGTPLYVYSLAQIKKNMQSIKTPFMKYFTDGIICYAVKANSNLNFIQLLAQNGFGFDIVSGGELMRVLQVQKHLNNVVYSGTSKTSSELELAIKNNIMMINCESLNEIKNINRIATQLGKKASVALRVNPALNPSTHSHINTGHVEAKFGIFIEQMRETILDLKNYSAIHFRGISCHIGSMIERESDYIEMIDALLPILEFLKKQQINIEFLDLGGGFPIQYTDEKLTDFEELFKTYKEKLQNYPSLRVIIEPGRYIIGNAGLILSTVTYTKKQLKHHFMFLDAGMTELIRPALYQANHKVISVTESLDEAIQYSVGGPICESSDLFQSILPLKSADGDIMLIENTGAYGYCMASNYNTRAKSPEVLIDNNEVYLINKRESYEEIWRNEILHDFQ